MGDDADWVNSKNRPKPPPLSASQGEVSRCSGLAVHVGTFGKSTRFAKDKVTGPGHSSPYGHLFYHRNQQNKNKLEERADIYRSPTLGIGERPHPAFGGPPPGVGPGTYNICFSAKGKKSSLDGPEFCTTTMKAKLPSGLVALQTPSPGPHARYEVRGPLDRRFPQYAKDKPLLSHGGRFRDTSGDTDPGPGHYADHTYKSVCHAASCPNLSGAGERCMEATGGTKRCLKSTFGEANRFAKDRVPNSSPQGDRYYAHSKIWGPEEYLGGVRTCGFGVCGKTDMANPLKGPRNDVGPGTYYPQPGYSQCYGRTSPLDGLTTRCKSPVAQFSKNAGSPKSANRMRSSPPGGASPSDGMSAGFGGGSPGGASPTGDDA